MYVVRGTYTYGILVQAFQINCIPVSVSCRYHLSIYVASVFKFFLVSV